MINFDAGWNYERVGHSLIQISKPKTHKNLMASCVSIQFDKQGFSTDVACLKWIRSSPYAYLETLKGFKLKTSANSMWMSTEPRKVFYWTDGLAYCKHILTERPQAHVLIILKGSQDIYARTDMPALSETAQAKLRDMEHKRELKDQEKLERRRKILVKRKRLATGNKGSSLSLARDIAAIDKKAEEKPKRRAPKKKVKKETQDALSPLIPDITKQEIDEFNKSVAEDAAALDTL